MAITNNSLVQFKYGTEENFNSIQKQDNVIYFLEDTGKLYIGNNQYTRPVYTGTNVPDSTVGADAPWNSLYIHKTLGNNPQIISFYVKAPLGWDKVADFDSFARLNSPAFTGTPTAPTAAAGTNTTQIATTAFVKTAVDSATAGLAGAMHYIGVTTTVITDGSTTSTISINSENVTATTGDVVIYGSKEFVFNGTSWAELGDPSNYILKVTGETGEVPKFDANGNLESTGFTLGTSVPADAVFTDTTYTIGGAASGNTWVTTLTPSAGTATTSTVPALGGASASGNGSAGLVPAPSTGDQDKYLAGDGTWKTLPTETDQRARWGSF